MTIKTASPGDIPLLAEMNQSLIEDEKSDVNLTLEQLTTLFNENPKE